MSVWIPSHPLGLPEHDDPFRRRRTREIDIWFPGRIQPVCY